MRRRLPQCTAGVALASHLVGEIDVSGFTVERASSCGAHVAPGCDLDLADGWICDDTSGACVQTPDHDIDRLRGHVGCRNNEVSFDTVGLPVPEPLPE